MAVVVVVGDGALVLTKDSASCLPASRTGRTNWPAPGAGSTMRVLGCQTSPAKAAGLRCRRCLQGLHRLVEKVMVRMKEGS